MDLIRDILSSRTAGRGISDKAQLEPGEGVDPEANLIVILFYVRLVMKEIVNSVPSFPRYISSLSTPTSASASVRILSACLCLCLRAC